MLLNARSWQMSSGTDSGKKRRGKKEGQGGADLFFFFFAVSNPILSKVDSIPDARRYSLDSKARQVLESRD